jgi:hypothetical protein
MTEYVLSRISFSVGNPSYSRFVTEYKGQKGIEGQMGSSHLGLWKLKGFQQHIVKVDILAILN